MSIVHRLYAEIGKTYIVIATSDTSSVLVVAGLTTIFAVIPIMLLFNLEKQ